MPGPYFMELNALSNAPASYFAQQTFPDTVLCPSVLWGGILCLLSGCWWGSVCERIFTRQNPPTPSEDAERGISRNDLPDQFPLPLLQDEEVNNVLSDE